LTWFNKIVVVQFERGNLEKNLQPVALTEKVLWL